MVSQRVAEVACERCGEVIRHQLEEHETTRRWICLSYLGLEWAGWVDQVTATALQQRAA